VKERYLLIRELGRGGFGTVYLAYDQNTQRQVAIKQLTNPTPDARERFHREALALYRQLNNQFIVDLLDHDLGDEPPYFVLEYCEHGSLRGWVGQRRAWQDIALLLAQVIQGLKRIHEVGGFHRDLKPDNLLLASGPTPQTVVVKIADFGLARVPDAGSAVTTRHIAGTNGYIAPEVIAGAVFHPGADIYSLGIVATELLTDARDPARIHQAKIPAALRDLVLTMCAADSTRRPTAQKIAVALHALLNPPQAPPPASGPSAGLVLGGLALFAAALVGLGALAVGNEGWDEEVRRYRAPDGRFKKG
jgi:serine/threonine protein kinase